MLHHFAFHGFMPCSPIMVLVLGAVVSADAYGKVAFDELNEQMLQSFMGGKFDSMSKSEVDSLMTHVSKSVRKGRAFHYIWKLHDAIGRETKRLDDLEDSSSKDWIIQAFRPALYSDDSVTFKACTLCEANSKGPGNRCNVTRVELLVPLVSSGVENETVDKPITVEINGYSFNSSTGTMDISRAAIFDVSSLILNHSGDVVAKITAQKHPCRMVYPKRAMLYEYCNINNTILQRFRTYSQKELNARVGQQRNRVDHRQNKRNESIDAPAGRLNWKEKLKTDMREVTKDMEVKLAKAFRLPLAEMNQTQTEKNSNTTKGDPEKASHGKHGEDLRNAGLSDSEVGGRWQAIRPRKPRSSRKTEVAPVRDKPRKSVRTSKKRARAGCITSKHQVINHKGSACNNSFQQEDGECTRRSFNVSLNSHLTRWDIIAPKMIDIGYCSKTCRHANHFANVNNEITAHAVIVNSMNIPTPPVTCSPHKMSTISIMKLNNILSIVVENLANARIESCWCT